VVIKTGIHAVCLYDKIDDGDTCRGSRIAKSPCYGRQIPKLRRYINYRPMYWEPELNKQNLNKLI
jgi:hypothetical protein